MKVYIVQKLTVSPGNSHYQNVAAFSKLSKAVGHCVKVLQLRPTNYINPLQFRTEEFQMFAHVQKIGLNNETDKKSNYHRIMSMEIIEEVSTNELEVKVT